MSGKFSSRAGPLPPEPDGYLHIGHAKSICLNFGVAALSPTGRSEEFHLEPKLSVAAISSTGALPARGRWTTLRLPDQCLWWQPRRSSIRRMPRADSPQACSVLTLGHGKHQIDKFLGLLRQHGVEVLVDARSQPFSRFSPQFSRNALERAVTQASIRYLFMGDLLGGRPAARACYDAAGKVDYDLVEAQEFYQRGIERLLDGVARFCVCILCAEEDPARCHRRLLITRTLTRRGIDVRHVRGTGAVETEAELRARERSGQLSLLAAKAGSGETEGR